ncbi:phenylalanine N-monooxygenase-like [Canna indica]|uniref:Phenylalanine N-monooxygenase-like n=1 Tax=Canna indica TaxID=4628 RepID=A0AAQ3QR73_9LILI|nr:phenylalanine N-monooxygenase-like [Canna indica]
MMNATVVAQAFMPSSLVTLPLPNVALLFASSLLIFLLHHLFGKTKRGGLPPGPTPWPIVGSLIPMLRNQVRWRWVVGKAEGNDITCFRFGGVHVVVVNSPELSREFFKKQDANFASRPLTMATEYSSDGYVTVVVSPWGDQWKKMRRVLASDVLNNSRLQKEVKLRTEETDHFTGYLYKRCAAGRTIDVRFVLRFYCGNVIRKMMYGVRYFSKGGEFGGPGEEELEHVDAAFDVLKCAYSFCPSDFLPSLRFLDYGGHEKIMKNATETVYKYHDPIASKRLEKWRSWREKGVEKKDVEDMLDIFLSLKDDNGKPLLSMKEIRAQCAELLYAIVDNPSQIVEWALAHLIDQPETMRKALEELDRVVGKDRLVQESDLPQLPYLKACTREALRIHPVAPFDLPHVAINDATVAGYFIPKGTMVLVSRVGLGRNPKVWDEPLVFNPDRHLKDGQTVELAEPDLRMLSFGAGRRTCMGGPLGSLMTYMLLGRMIQAFEWSMPSGESRVDFSEDKWSLFRYEPLCVRAKPRLSTNLLANL